MLFIHLLLLGLRRFNTPWLKFFWNSIVPMLEKQCGSNILRSVINRESWISKCVLLYFDLNILVRFNCKISRQNRVWRPNKSLSNFFLVRVPLISALDGQNLLLSFSSPGWRLLVWPRFHNHHRTKFGCERRETGWRVFRCG